ncbi:hypothetical protein [Bradyrhizobium sp. USDA 4504]
MNSPDPNFYGITLPLVLSAVLTLMTSIGAAFFSARWGTAQARRQFTKQIEDDERAAAAELIPLLLKLSLDCDRKKNNLSLYLSSDGEEGNDEPMSGVNFPAAIHAAAARLGPSITERAIKLETCKTRAEGYVHEGSGHIDRFELDQSILSFLALLSLRARYLVDQASERVGLRARHPKDDMDRLLKEAMKHMHEIDSGNEESWY